MAKTKLEDVLKRFKSVKAPTTSVFRNESLQTKTQVPRISRLKKERKKKSKLLVLREIALDFDPISGVETDMYNRDSKYRPAISATTMMLNLKELADANESTKVALLRKSGLDVTEWDTTDITTLNQKDKEVFLKHLYPSIYTVNVCKVRLKSVANGPYGRDFQVDVERDKMTGQVVGEEPITLKLNRFLNMIAAEEYNAFAEENKDTGKYTDKDLQDMRDTIRDKTVLISSDRPSNFAIAIEIPLNERTEIPNEFSLKGWEKSDFLEHMVLIPLSGKFKDAINNYKDGNYYKADKHNDFLEIDMYCTNDEDKMLLGKNTSYEKPSETIKEHADYNTFLNSFREFMDNDNNLEGIFQASNFISKMAKETEDALCDAVAAFIPENDPRITQNVIDANLDVVNRMYSDEFLSKADLGLTDKGTSDVKEVEKEESILRAAFEETGFEFEDGDTF